MVRKNLVLHMKLENLGPKNCDGEFEKYVTKCAYGKLRFTDLGRISFLNSFTLSFLFSSVHLCDVRSNGKGNSKKKRGTLFQHTFKLNMSIREWSPLYKWVSSPRRYPSPPIPVSALLLIPYFQTGLQSPDSQVLDPLVREQPSHGG